MTRASAVITYVSHERGAVTAQLPSELVLPVDNLSLFFFILASTWTNINHQVAILLYIA